MKKCISILAIMVFVFVALSPAFAEETSTNPPKDVAQYSGNVVTGSVKTVGEAAKGTTETAVSPLVAFWRWMTGKGKGEKVVTDPVEKSGKTVYDATVNTGKTVVGEK